MPYLARQKERHCRARRPWPPRHRRSILVQGRRPWPPQAAPSPLHSGPRDCEKIRRGGGGE
eukprot:10303252-Lingulodinium_polyedra.AAC.1